VVISFILPRRPRRVVLVVSVKLPASLEKGSFSSCLLCLLLGVFVVVLSLALPVIEVPSRMKRRMNAGLVYSLVMEVVC